MLANARPSRFRYYDTNGLFSEQLTASCCTNLTQPRPLPRLLLRCKARTVACSLVRCSGPAADGSHKLYSDPCSYYGSATWTQETAFTSPLADSIPSPPSARPPSSRDPAVVLRRPASARARISRRWPTSPFSRSSRVGWATGLGVIRRTTCTRRSIGRAVDSSDRRSPSKPASANLRAAAAAAAPVGALGSLARRDQVYASTAPSSAIARPTPATAAYPSHADRQL